MNLSNTEIFGMIAIVIMVVSYALEKRHPMYIAIFAIGCALAAIYALLLRSYPFMIAESIWAFIALQRWRVASRVANSA